MIDANETERLRVADLVDAETWRAYEMIKRHYGYDYARAWLAGRTHATEEIRAL